MASGLNIHIGTDNTDFQKGISLVEKQLKTLAGQEAIIEAKIEVPQEGELAKKIREQVIAAQGVLESARLNVSDYITYDDKDVLKKANASIKNLRKELKEVQNAGDSGKSDWIRNQIVSLQEYIAAVKQMQKALSDASLSTTMPKQAQAKIDRSEINAEIKALEKRRELLQGNTGISETARLQEEIKLQQQLIGLIQKKNATYKSGSSKSGRKALYDAQQQLESLRTRKKEIEAANRLAAVQQKINTLESERASTAGIGKKISQYQAEYAIVSKLITAWRSYAVQAAKAGDMAGVQVANQKVAALEQQRTALRNLADEERARIRATNQNNSLLNDQGRLLGKLKTLAANYLSVFAVFNFGKKIVETTGYFEQQKVALQGILGSAAAATQAINELRGMALESPFELKDLVGYTKQLSAYGIEVENLLPVTKQLADLSTGLGVDMGRLILAYGQVKSAAVLRGQELRQFTEAGIPMVAELAKRFTELNGRLVTTGEVFDLISKRQVPFEMVASVLSDMTAEGGKFYKMQENITDTLYGQVQKLKDMWTISLNSIGSSISGVLRGFVGMLQGVVKNIRAVLYTISGVALANSVKLVAREMVVVKQGIIESARAMATFGRRVVHANSAAWGLRTAIRGIGAALKSNIFMAAFSLIAGAIANAVVKAKEFSDTMESIDISFAKDTAKYVQGFDALIGKLSSATEGTKEYNAALETLKNNYGDYVNSTLISQLIAERRQLDDTAEGWGVLRDSIVAAIQAEKDYEKHKSKKETAGNQIVEDAKSLKKLFGRELKQRLNEDTYVEGGLLVSDTKRKEYRAEKNYYREIYSGVKSSKAQEAYVSALESFLGQDVITKEKLQEEIGKSFVRSGVAENVTKYVVENIDKIWASIEDTKVFKKYEEENDILEDNPRHIVDKRFEEAQRTTAGRQEGRWVEGMANKDYNPAKLNQAEDYDYANAVTDLIGMFDEQVKKKRVYKDDTALFSDKENGYDTYNKALDLFREQVDGVSVDSFAAAGKTKEVADALQNLANTIVDGDLHQLLSKITNDFTKFAGLTTGQAAETSTNLQNDFLNNSGQSREFKDFIMRWLPTDETFDAKREALVKQYQANKGAITSYEVGGLNAENRKEVERLKKENRQLEILAGGRYYGVNLSEKSGGGSVSIKTELNDFINNFKKAYETYKNAVQKGGVEMGLGYVRNDAQFKDMFGQYFGGKDSEDFKKLDKVKVGNKSVGTMIQDKFIVGGLEDGIMDFEKAARVVAEELMAYYKGDKQHRTAFKTASEQLTKWVESTIAKDNLNSALADLENEVKDLSRTFENTNKNVELYRKLLQNGTADTLGKDLGVTRSEAMRPQSARQKENVQAVVAKYNEQVAATSSGKGAEYSLGNISSIQDVDAALRQIAELRKMNGENFSTTELGQTTATIEGLLQTLRNTMVQEISSISGQQFTGNELQDIIANAIKSVQMRNAEAEQQAEIAKANGVTDQTITKRRLEGNQTDATALYDQFLKDNRFDALATGKLGKIEVDFGALKQKFEEQFKDVPAELKTELEKKLTDLEISVQTYNSSIGSLGSFGDALKTYRNADATAKAEYDKTEGNVATIQQQLDSGTNVLTGAPLTDAEIAQLNVELASSKAYLEELGEDGVNLAQKLKKVSLQNMTASLEKAQSMIGTFSSAVTSTVSAAKSLVSVVNKVYDVMNDGENPAWMQDAEAFLGDFGETFEQLIAPIFAVIGMISSLTVAITVCEAAATPLIIITAVLIAAAAIIAGIVAAIQQHDRALERQNEELDKQIEETENAMKNLNAAAENMTGFDKFETQLKSTGKNLEIYQKYMEQMRNEEKKKNTDEDKVKEYEQKAKETLADFYSGLKDLQDELTGSVESWADAISDALRSAFQNGENAARAMKSTVKEMIGDIVEEMMKMAILEPLLQNSMEELLGGTQEQIRQKYTDSDDKFDAEGYTEYVKSALTDSKKLDKFESSATNAGEVWLETYAAMEEKLKEYLAASSDTSNLSAGIESITEDTARTLEGLFNSQLSVTIQIQQSLENYFASNNSSGTRTTITNILTHVSSINSNVALLLRGLNELRDTQVKPIHVTIV